MGAGQAEAEVQRALERHLIPGKPMLFRVEADRLDFWLEEPERREANPLPSERSVEFSPVRCNRCNHVGPTKGRWVPFRGTIQVCAECESEDCVRVQEG
jgi:hypothetical protein